MTKQENLKRIYKQIDHGQKLNFTVEVAEHFKAPVQSVRVNWLSGLFSPPSKHIDEVIKMAQNKVRNQNN